jgi:hypothetical protein
MLSKSFLPLVLAATIIINGVVGFVDANAKADVLVDN